VYTKWYLCQTWLARFRQPQYGHDSLLWPTV